MADEKLYLVSPGPNRWICYDALVDELWEWSTSGRNGAPSLTISRREEEPDDGQ